MNSAFEIKVILNMQANKRANHILSFTQNKQLSPGCPKLPPMLGILKLDILPLPSMRLEP